MNLMELRRRAPELLDEIITQLVLDPPDPVKAVEAALELERYVAGLRKSLERKLQAKKEHEGR